MKKHIVEDLPARKFPQASLSKNENNKDREGGEEKTPEKKVRQAVYDIKYRARRENIPLRSAYTQYMQNSSMSEQEKGMVREKLFGNGGIVKETYLNDISSLATKSVANAMFKVFVENEIEKIDEEYLEELKKGYIKKEIGRVEKGAGEKKYKIRVTDNSGVSYVRYATREKINQLRSNPNIKEVEMTEYGEPYEGEKNKGEQTATATSGKGLAKKDYDRDGKVESPAKEHAGAVHNAIQRKRGGVPDGKDTSSVKEEYLGKTNDKNTLDVKKQKKNKIVIHYNNDDNKSMNENSYSKFLELINEKEMTKSEKIKEKNLKSKYDDSEMKASMIKQYGPEKGPTVYFATIRKQAMREENCETDNKSGEDDSRSMPTKVRNFKNRLRAMGLKMSYEHDGNVIDEGMGLSVGLSNAVGKLMSNPRTSASQGSKNFQKTVTDPIGRVVKDVVKTVVSPVNNSPEVQKTRRDKYRPE